MRNDYHDDLLRHSPLRQLIEKTTVPSSQQVLAFARAFFILFYLRKILTSRKDGVDMLIGNISEAAQLWVSPF